MTAPASSTPSNASAVRVARWGLFVLTLVNLFNYLDRFVLSALVESLKKDPHLHLSDTQLGALATGFLIVYMLTSPVFGTLGDRGARPRLIAVGVAVWSVATALGGVARNFLSLFAARATVGVGEAAYGTVSPAMLADYFPAEQRGRVFSVFYAAMPVGAALGLALGGLVDSHYGWRAAFFVAGVPGLILAWMVARLADPPRGGHDTETVPAHAPTSKAPVAAYLELLKNIPYVYVVLGYAAYTFAIGALGFWMPAFLERERGMTRVDATVQFGVILVVTGFVGTSVGGWLGDRLLRRFKESYLWVSGISTLAAVPFAWIAFTSRERPVYMASIVVAEVLVFISTGPVNLAIVNSVAPERRATAMALSILAIHLLGDGPSPSLVGRVSDVTSLGHAMLILPVAFALSGLIWIFGAFRGERGERARPTSSPVPSPSSPPPASPS
ncbi:MAG TPA: MFS transporter [Thermoanaerobaculia bacterium]|jgi:MFS family permease|nr:MFS transporter [Thermoanaerobaculia bacterium]